MGHLSDLAELLTPKEDGGGGFADGLDVQQGARAPALHPGAIGAPASSQAKAKKTSAGADTKAIWEDHEILDHVEADDYDDGRECPPYDFLYKQAVATEDVYLGLSGKDPSSTDCEDLVLKVELRGTQSMAELELDVEDTYVKIRSPKYKLGLHLPHKTDSKKGSAKWDKEKETLTVTLRIVREDPF